MKVFILLLSLVQLSAFAQSLIKESKDKALSKCFYYNTACPLGAEFAAKSVRKNKEDHINKAYEFCATLDKPKRHISCLHGATFFFAKYLGQENLMKKAYKTVPWIVYTEGHSLGITISLLNSFRDCKLKEDLAESKCESISYDSDVLKRCFQGIEAFKSLK